jgi:membrane protein implicated in regulation of membrane protease activity
VFAGCHDATALSPQAVGGIVAVGVLVFCALCFGALWCVRKGLYRPVAKRKSYRGSRLEMGGGRGITVTREVKVEGNGRAEV